MGALWQDARYAARALVRSPGLTLAAVVTFALGIGANATIFGVVDTLLLRPPPGVRDPGRVVRLYFQHHSRTFGTFTSSTNGYPLFERIRDSVPAFSGVAAYSRAHGASLGRGVDARPVDLELASASYFRLLGVAPAVGRFYDVDEDRVGGPAVIVLGYAFWRRQFGGDSAVLGRQVQLGHVPYTVVGVAPQRFTGVNLENVDVWAPLTAATPDLMGPSWLNRGSYFLQIIGRVRRDADFTQVARHATLALRAEDALGFGEHDSLAVALLGPIQEARGPEMSKDAKVSTWLAAVSIIVLLIACANVANLLLARATRRQREIAIRVAMGAGRRGLARLVLTESALLGLAGGLAALLVTLWAGPLVRAFLLPRSPALAGAVDGRVLAFTALASLVTGLLAGLAPMWQLGGSDLTPALKAGAGEGRFRRSHLRSGLLVGQVALTVVLIVGAGLFVRSLRNVQDQDFGFDPARTILATADLRIAGYGRAGTNATYLRMLERVAALPGVEHAAVTVGHPFGWSFGYSVRVPGRDSIPQLTTGGPYYQAVTPDYFAAMGTPVRGRGFTMADRTAPVAIVNQTMARLLWPGAEALGKCFFAGSDKRCAEIVGIVPDARRFNAVEDTTMLFYVPFTGDSSAVVTALVARVGGRPEDLIVPVSRAMQATAADIPYARVTTLADLVAPSIRPWRLGSTMFGSFAGLALALAAVGLYGVLAYTVAQRTHEVGIRVALGAARSDVLRMVVFQGVRVALLGTLAGAVIALLAGRVLRSLLYGVTAHDPLVLLVAAITPLIVAALASYLPARRATRVDPMVALRYE